MKKYQSPDFSSLSNKPFDDRIQSYQNGRIWLQLNSLILSISENDKALFKKTCQKIQKDPAFSELFKNTEFSQRFKRGFGKSDIPYLRSIVEGAF